MPGPNSNLEARRERSLRKEPRWFLRDWSTARVPLVLDEDFVAADPFTRSEPCVVPARTLLAMLPWAPAPPP